MDHIYEVNLPTVTSKINLRTGYSYQVLYLFTAQSRLLTTLIKETLENIGGKGENAGK